jgi:hypothetical protein
VAGANVLLATLLQLDHGPLCPHSDGPSDGPAPSDLPSDLPSDGPAPSDLPPTRPGTDLPAH